MTKFVLKSLLILIKQRIYVSYFCRQVVTAFSVDCLKELVM